MIPGARFAARSGAAIRTGLGRGRVPGRAAWRLILALVCVAFAGCATYMARHQNLRADLAAGRYDAALRELDAQRRPRDELLYLLETGLVLHEAGRWAASNASFERAEELAADLYTKSVSQAAFSVVTSDLVVDYRAAAFEMSLVPYYRALGYIGLGQRDEALVEARKASLFLQQYADAERRQEEENRSRSLYNFTALQYLSGLLYESGGETNDAFIAYRAAAHASGDDPGVEPPPWLGQDLLRVGTRLGFQDELDELRRQAPHLFRDAEGGRPDAEPPQGEADSQADSPAGEVVVLIELGDAPYKTQREIDVPILAADHYDDHDAWARAVRPRLASGWHTQAKVEYWLRVAVPELVDGSASRLPGSIVVRAAGQEVAAVVVEDVGRRARQTFEAQETRVLLKTLARALAKYAATRQVRGKSPIAGALTNILGVATEQADTRCWLSLPGTISMARLSLPPGKYDLEIEHEDGHGGRSPAAKIPDVKITSGGWTFLERRLH